MADLKQKVAKGAIWTLLEKLSCQGVSFVVSMILARLLTPTDYGTVALTGIFFALAGFLVDCGFGNALIQKKDADDLDFNSVFYLNVTMSLVAYGLIFIAAPWIARFFSTPELTAITRVSAICLFFTAIDSVQNAELVKKMLFNLSFRISVITTVTSAIVGVALAFWGAGVWALVSATLASRAVGVVTRWLIIAWRPKLMFSFARLAPLFSFGWKLSLSEVAYYVFSQLDGLLIGKFYTKADLAMVNRGRSLPKLIIEEIEMTLGRVSYPAFVQMQNDKVRLRSAMRRMIQSSTFLIFPMMVGAAASAHTTIELAYGEQWRAAVPFMMITCFGFALTPFQMINLRGMLTIGRSDIHLILSLIKRTAHLISILVFLRYGLLVFVAAGAFVLGPLSVVVNAWPSKKFLNYPLGMQIMDVMPSAWVCIGEGATVWGIEVLFSRTDFCYAVTGSVWSLIGLLLLQILGGAIVYFGQAYFFKLRPMGECIDLVVKLLGDRTPKFIQIMGKRFENDKQK